MDRKRGSNSMGYISDLAVIRPEQGWLRGATSFGCSLLRPLASNPLRWIEMRERTALAIVFIGLAGWAAGCGNRVDQAEFKSAINKSFAGRHECAWPEPTKLPA